MAERREYQGAAAPAALSAPINTSATTLTINTTAGWPTGSTGPFTIVIDPGTSSEEKIKCVSRSGAAITVATGGRGVDGTSAASHSVNAVVKHILGAYDIDLVNKHAADTTQDDHTQYVHVGTARTISAAHNFTNAVVFSGAPVFSGNPVFSGAPHFTGTPLFDNMGVLSDLKTIDTGAASAGTSPKPMRADAKLALDMTSVTQGVLPAGVMMDFAGTSPPTGWLICDGREVARAAYPALFAAIGTSWGAGNGTTTFNLPNCVGRVSVGSGDVGHPFAGTGGSLTHSLSTSELAAHTHDHSHGHSVSDPGHRHYPARQGIDVYELVIASPNTEQNYIPHNGFGDSTNNTQVTYSFMGNQTTGLTVNSFSGNTGSTGSGSAFSIEQPWLALNKIIKAH